jgi:hypothetical protein
MVCLNPHFGFLTDNPGLSVRPRTRHINFRSLQLINCFPQSLQSFQSDFRSMCWRYFFRKISREFKGLSLDLQNPRSSWQWAYSLCFAFDPSAHLKSPNIYRGSSTRNSDSPSCKASCLYHEPPGSTILDVPKASCMTSQQAYTLYSDWPACLCPQICCSVYILEQALNVLAHGEQHYFSEFSFKS